MPAGAQWSWLEAYGLMEAILQSCIPSNGMLAHQTVERALERQLPRERMNAELEKSAAMADRAPEELLHQGSGWGALERHRRDRATQPPQSPSETRVSEVSRNPDRHQPHSRQRAR